MKWLYLAFLSLTIAVEIENWAHLPLHSPPETIIFLDDGKVAVGTFPLGQPDRFAAVHPTGNGQLHIFSAEGEPIRVVDLPGIPMNVHHGAVHPVTGDVLVTDVGNSRIIAVNLKDGSFRVWADELGAFPDDYDFDVHGNMYLTEFIEGFIWKISPDGTKKRWLEGGLLAAPKEFMAFGVNGIVFNQKQDALFVSHSGLNYIVRIPILEDYEPGEPEIWSVGFLFPNGLAIDENGHLFVAELLGNSVSILNKDGTLIGRISGFEGVDDKGAAIGLLSPAELNIRDGFLYVTNCAADFNAFLGLPARTDGWVRRVKVHTVNRIKIDEIQLWEIGSEVEENAKLRTEL